MEFLKKAISFYIPNRLIQWNEIGEVENPTRYPIINDVIKSMNKLEEQIPGIKTQARRAMTDV